MKAIIQAGGAGTRLRPITYEIPKPLLTVRKKPILNYTVEFLKRHGVREIGIIASVEHRPDFEKWLTSTGKDISANVSLFFEEKPSGTFGWVKNLRGWLGNERFVLTNGDTLLDFDLKQVLDLHDKNRPVATMALLPVDNANDYGAVSLDQSGHVISFVEKPRNVSGPSLVSTGCYVLEPSIFDHIDNSKNFIMIERDILPALAEQRKVFGTRLANGRFHDCGTLERWEKAIHEW